MMAKEKILRILILEDNPDDRELMERQLRKESVSFVSECVDTRDEFMEAIARFKPDVILSDHGLPEFNSMEALKITLKERLDIPFILVTGAVTEEFAISSLKGGAHDYILKSNLSRLPTAVYRAIREKKQEIRRKEAEEALKKQNEELLKANSELDHFVYSVSHNLRGPLASVLGLLNVAHMEDREKKLSSIHTLMGNSIHKLDETLKEIVAYSHNSRKEIKTEVVDWKKLIDSSFSSLHYLNTDKPVSTVIDVNDSFPFYSDPERLEIVFENLLSNAIIYQAKQRELIIGIVIDVKPEEVMITVTDNGIGIEELALPRIFEMFYRGSNQSRGPGLGLYIAREIITKLKGNIAVTSVDGQGTTVKIMIPTSADPNQTTDNLM